MGWNPGAFRVGVCFLVTLAGELAFAQQAGPGAAKFRAFIASSLHRDLVDKAVGSLPPVMFSRCASLKSLPGEIAIIQPITLSAEGVPNGGAWIERLPVSGCGNDTSLNFLFSLGSDGLKINSLALMPGATRASPLLQKDTLAYVRMGFAMRVKDCQNPLVVNTRFEGFGLKSPVLRDPGEAAGAKRPWWETWTVKGCGRTLDVPVDFVPDATGTQITQPASAIVER